MNRLTVMRGDSTTLTLTLTDTEGDPLDLTGADVRFSAGDLLSKRLGDGITVATPASGVATISLAPDDTADAPDHRMAYDFDVQLELANGSIVTPLRGLFVVVPDVTTTE